MALHRITLLSALTLSGAIFAQSVLAQSFDPTPPNARTMGDPPTFTDTPALGVPVEGRAAAEDPFSPYDYDDYRTRRSHPRVYVDPNY
jgi:hypothetical protein